MLTPTGLHVEFEVAQTRREAAWLELVNSISDFAAGFLVDRREPLTTALFNKVASAAGVRFAQKLPQQMIWNIVQAQFAVEQQKRTELANLPKPVRKDRFGRPIKPPDGKN
jgi:hypothetical protein